MNLETAIGTVAQRTTDKSLWEYVSELKLDAAMAYDSICKLAEPDADRGAAFPPEMLQAWATLNSRLYALQKLDEAAQHAPYAQLTQATAEVAAFRESAHEKMKLVQSWYTVE